MNPLSFCLAVALLAPLLGALLLYLSGPERLARPLALAAAAVSFVAAMGTAAFWATGFNGLWLFRVDAISAALLPLSAGVTGAALWLAPRRTLAREAARATLWTLALQQASWVARDGGVLAALVALSLVPSWSFARRNGQPGLAKLLGRYNLLIAVPLLCAAVGLWVVGHRTGLSLPLDLNALSTAQISNPWQLGLFAAIAISALCREALVPLHSWAPHYLEKGHPTLALSAVTAPLGILLLLRIALPVLPDASVEGMAILAVFGVVSALFGTVLAFAQTHIRRMIGFFGVSQSGLLLAGVAWQNSLSLNGTLILLISTVTVQAGLLLVAQMVEARTGTADWNGLGGLVRGAPQMSICFCLLGLAAVGLPGTLSFVGEDLLLHGILETHPVEAILLLLSAGLNGVTMLRAFGRIFLGPLHSAPIKDLLPRERAVLYGFCGLLVMGGLYPAPLLALGQRAAGEILQMATSEPAALKAH